MGTTPLNNKNHEIILASASKVRARLLKNAGVIFSVQAAHVDEAAIKSADDAKGMETGELAACLAQAKALEISLEKPHCLVIGADQILQCGERLFDKPVDRHMAREHLRHLRGKTHALVNATCVLRNGDRVWHYTDQAHLTMRSFDDDFVERYLDKIGTNALGAVGAYHLEELGAQLFSRVEGDFFSILGLPLLPLLAFLREQGVVAP